MINGFVYVVTTLTKDYIQRKFCNVPTEWGDRLYFGPCKIPMRPKMKCGDYVFGISPAKPQPRRVHICRENRRTHHLCKSVQSLS